MNDKNEFALPDFTKQDYMETTRPYEWLAGFENDPFTLRQKMLQMKADATSKGARGFVSLWNDFRKSRQLTITQPGLVTNFPKQPLNLCTGGKYICDESGVMVNRFGAELCICLHPVLPVKRLINIDTGEEKLEIAFYKGGLWRRIIVSKADLASSTQILQLAAYGIMVNSENAKWLSTYLLEMEHLNYLPLEGYNTDTIPEQRSVSRLGWTDDQKAFSPYVNDIIFDGEVSFRHIFSAVKSAGSPDVWIMAMKKLRAERGAGRFFLAASFASVLIEPCGLLPFFLHSWGQTETGKTVGLMVAASVWASPKMGEYIATFNSTAVGQELFAGFLNSLPLCLDELQIQSSAGLKDFDKIVYQLTEGVGRTRGAKTGGLQKQSRWRNCILSSGEHPISSSGSGGGAVNRILQLEIKTKIYHDLPDLCRIIALNYGHAGKAFIDHLQLPGNLDRVRELQQGFYEALLKGLSTEKQAASASVILAADKIATELFFQDGNALTIEDMASVMASREEVDANRRALRFIFDMIASNPDRFDVTTGGEVWGKTSRDESCIYIIKTIFDRAMASEGFNPAAFLSWADRMNLLNKDLGHRTKNCSFNSTTIRTVCLKYNKAEALLNSDGQLDFTQDDDLPF